MENHKTAKLGLIAGRGKLPELLINHCKNNNIRIFVIAINGETPKELISSVDHEWISFGKIGKAIKILKGNKIKTLVFAGTVKKPSFNKIKPDIEGVKLLSKIISMKMQGDDAILTTVISYFEKKGFCVVGVHEILEDILMPEGIITKIKPRKNANKSINIAAKAALAIGELDVGQAVIVENGRIIGTEDANGTDNLIKRCSSNGEAILVKMKKPKQEERIDLPTIGIETVINAASSGIIGIAAEAGGTIILDKTNVIKKANELGIFICGIKIPTTEYKKWKKEKFSL